MSKELVKVTQNENGEQLVSGRELHEFLEVKSKFIDWFNRMCEYGFEENIDYIKKNEVSQKKEGSRFVNREQVDYIIKISMAKEISMIQRNKKGKQARKYFIECEEKLKGLKVSKKEMLLLGIINAKGDVEMAQALNKYENEYVKPMEEDLKETSNKLQHKQEVIDVMVDEIKLKTQRQFLVEIIKMKPNSIRERWNMLYKIFEQNKHINLSARFEAYNLINKPKIKSKLEYVDRVLNDIPCLYRLAVKLFESDFKDKLQKYMDAL